MNLFLGKNKDILLIRNNKTFFKLAKNTRPIQYKKNNVSLFKTDKSSPPQVYV